MIATHSSMTFWQRLIPVRKFQSHGTAADQIERAVARYLFFFGGAMGIQFIIQAIITILHTDFIENTEYSLLLTGIISICAYLCFVIIGKKAVPYVIFGILSINYANGIWILSIDGHWEPWVWMNFVTTFLLQSFLLRGKSLQWLRYLLFGSLLIAYCIPTLIQEFILQIKPLLEGVPADAQTNVFIYGYTFIILFIAVTINELLFENVIDNTTSLNEELDSQKKAFLQVFASFQKLQIYVDAYLKDMSHEVQNALNPLIGLIRLANKPKTREIAIKEFLRIAEPRLILSSQYIQDTKTHMSASFSSVVKAANTALLTREVDENVDQILTEMKAHANQLQKAFYAEPGKFDVDEYQTQLDSIARGQTKVQVKIDIDRDLSGVDTYPLALRTITTNLLVNSIKYVDSEDAKVQIKVYRDQQWIHLYVSDNGEGIPDHIIENMFDAQEGNIGLWLVGQVTKLTHSTIEVTANNCGTNYKIKIPILN